MQKTHNLHAFMLLVSECALAALKKLLIVIIYIFNKVVDLWRVTSLKKRLQYRCILIFEDIFFYRKPAFSGFTFCVAASI